MKKYRLIKEYPGSPLLGEIARQSNRFNLQNTYYIDNTAVMNFPEKYSEFWQEVVEKDYEILSFKTNRNIYTKDKDNIFRSIDVNDSADRINMRTESYMLTSSETYKIHQVKRLSDGEIFTIGDTVRYYHHKKDIFKNIIKFYIEQDILMVTTIDSLGECSAALSQHEKIKEPLFTTEDGVDIFEGDKFYTLLRDLSNLTITECKASVHSKFEKYIDFSTKEKAEEYILMNKPCLSLNDIIEDISKATKIKNVKNTNMIKSLKELVNTKING